MKFIEARVKKVTIQNKGTLEYGTAALNNVKFRVAGPKNSFIVRMPLYMHMDAQHNLKFQALEFSYNLMTADITVSHGKLSLPPVKIIVGNKVISIEDKEIEKQFESTIPDIVNKLRTVLHELAQEQVPSMLDDLAKNFIEKIEKEEDLAAPNDNNEKDPVTGKIKKKVPLKFGLQMNGPIRTDASNNLRMDLNSYILDPLNPSAFPVKAEKRAEVQFSKISIDQYDYAISVDQEILNRPLILSFERKLFKEISTADDPNEKLSAKCQALKDSITAKSGKLSATALKSFISLMDPPKIVDIGNYQVKSLKEDEAYARLKLHLKVSPGTVNGSVYTIFPKALFIKDGFEMYIDIIAKIQRSADPRFLEVHMWDVDDASLNINQKDINIGFLTSTVKGTILDTLHDTVQMWRCKHAPIADKIQAPSMITGIDASIKHISMDAAGHLDLYLNFIMPNNGGL